MRWSQLVSLGESSENVRLSSFVISEEFSAILESTQMSFDLFLGSGKLEYEINTFLSLNDLTASFLFLEFGLILLFFS